MAKDKGGTGEGMITQLKLSPLFYLDSLLVLNSLRALLDHLPKLLHGIKL